MTLAELLPLIGVPIMVIGFVLRLNPMLVVTGAGIATGLAVGMSPLDLLELIGEKFLDARLLVIFVLVLPIIGLMERHGLRERTRRWIVRFRGASAGRILIAYFIVREIAASIGLPVGGQVSTVRPLLVPMLEGAATAHLGQLSDKSVNRIRAHAAAAENIAQFFGEDIFIAYGAVLLIDAFLRENGIVNVDPLTIGLWGIPPAIAGLVIHSIRLTRLNAALARDADEEAGP